MPPNTIPEPLDAEFESLNAAVQAIKHFVITRGESYLVSHADKTRYILTCCDSYCKFGIRAAMLKGPKFRVTRYTVRVAAQVRLNKRLRTKLTPQPLPTTSRRNDVVMPYGRHDDSIRPDRKHMLLFGGSLNRRYESVQPAESETQRLCDLRTPF